jgi:arginase family enzyme
MPWSGHLPDSSWRRLAGAVASAAVLVDTEHADQQDDQQADRHGGDDEGGEQGLLHGQGVPAQGRCSPSARAVATGRFPLVYGGDCTTLLGTVPELHRTGPLSPLFVDGHEDTMPLDVSEDGEAANTEIGLLLGLTGRLLAGPLAARVGALRREELAVLGPRDAAWRRQFNVGTLREKGVWFRDWEETAAAPEQQAGAAVAHLKHASDRWWMHVDLDVPDRSSAGDIVALVRAVAAALPA